MIKTSGYRVSPTEIEEVVYATGLVRDAVALGVDDERLGQRIVLVVSRPRTAGSTPSALLADLRKRLPLYMVPKRRRRARRDAALAQRQVRPHPAAPGVERHDSDATVAAYGRSDGDARRRRRSRSTGSPSASARRRSSPTTARLHHRARRGAARTLPRRHQPRLRDQGQPDAGGGAAPRRAGRRARRRLGAGDAGRAGHADAGRSNVSFAGPGKTDAELRQAVAAGVIVELESETEARRVAAGRRARWASARAWRCA